MGVQLIAAFLVTCLLLYLPGSVFLYRGGGFDRAVLFSPIVSIALYTVMGVVLGALHVFTSALLIIALTILICFAVTLVRRKQLLSRFAGDDQAVATIAIKGAFLACVLSCVALYCVFYSRFAFGKEIIQGYDTVYHVNLVRSFIQSGNFSILNTSTYIDANAPISVGSAFYPAGWHVLVALVSDCVSLPVAGAVNIVNLCFAGVVFPASIIVFLSYIFFENRQLVRYGAIAACVFLAFPWLILLKGEQFPQLASFAVVPSSAAVFISADQQARAHTKACLAHLALFAVSLFALVALQTNAVFTVGIICLFYMLKQINEGELFGVVITRHRKSICIIVCVVAFALWFAISRLGFMQSIVEYNWPSFATPVQALVNVLTLAFGEETFAQITLGLIVVLGFIRAWYVRRYRWVGALSLFLAAIYVVAVSSEGFAKHYLAGFWYTDPVRLGAMAVIAFIPLACLGFDALYHACAEVMRRFFVLERSDRPSKMPKGCLMAALAVAAAAFFLFPNYSVQGHDDVETPFGYFRSEIERLSSASYPNILDTAEEEEMPTLLDLVGDSLVINIPDDGSAYCYGLYDMNVYYHRNYRDNDSESKTSKLIRRRLDEYATNEDVRQAVKSVQAKYVLQLDDGEDESSNMLHTYRRRDWSGILAITEDTPGFKLVYKSGDIRLFEIIGES